MNADKFNLVDECWIPIMGDSKVSLRRVFTDKSLRAVGGNPIEKIALLKLFLAIAQAACTPKGDKEWSDLSIDAFSAACTNYLDKWKDSFFLYGKKPFLQMPAVADAKKQPYGAISPEVAINNTTVLTQYSMTRPFDDSEKALLLLCQMGFAFGGKKADNDCILTPGYKGKKDANKKHTPKPGSSLLAHGLLHSFFSGSTILETIYYNIFTDTDIRSLKVFPLGVGIPPWEVMPEGEDCPRAQEIRESLIGRLVPLGRFCLLLEDELHYTEGIIHLDYTQGMIDPSASGNFSIKKPSMNWVNPDARPWRILPSLLNFLGSSSSSASCPQLSFCLPRIKTKAREFTLWSGGVSVTSNAGEYYLSANDDYVESSLCLSIDFMNTHTFSLFSKELLDLNNLAKILYASVKGYYEKLNISKSARSKIASNASMEFWEMVEIEAQNLIQACCTNNDELSKLRLHFTRIARRVYDKKCSFNSARQLNAYSLSKPQFNKYLNSK